jgi:hypothetical protein
MYLTAQLQGTYEDLQGGIGIQRRHKLRRTGTYISYEGI